MYNGIVKKVKFVGVTSDVALNMLTMTSGIFEEAWVAKNPDALMNFDLTRFSLHAGIGEVVMYTVQTESRLEGAALVHEIPHMFDTGKFSTWVELIGGTEEAQALILEELAKET